MVNKLTPKVNARMLVYASPTYLTVLVMRNPAPNDPIGTAREEERSFMPEVVAEPPKACR
jgi:hypothetical protein